MTLLSDAFSSFHRPAVRGVRGAIASAHPLASAAGQNMLALDGNAVDAAIAAQAVLAVIAPEACGLGGDMLALVAPAAGGGAVEAVAGVGRAPLRMRAAAIDGASSITVPGIVGGWDAMSRRWGRLPLDRCLAPAVALARGGFAMSAALRRAADAQRDRLLAGGAGDWAILHAAPGETVAQPRLADLLDAVGRDGADAFYRGRVAEAIERAVAARGGTLDREDLAAHETLVSAPVEVVAAGWSVSVQPPPTQGVLLAMALQARDRFGAVAADMADHLGIELTEAAFESRSDCAQGAALLARRLEADPGRAARRGGPRAYLHTAGVCASDASGLVVASLVSVFDDFGSGTFVPELGIALNNRAAGFTHGANAAAPGKRPIHTLAPALIRGPAGTVAMATPGADGQVQTLLQVIGHVVYGGATLDAAVAAPRWRSEGGQVLIEEGHPSIGRLDAMGHRIRVLAPGDMRFGGLVCAGSAGGAPFALADWRRECWSGAA